MHIKRLEHPWADDGKLHPTRCWPCEGTGCIPPLHIEKHLGKCPIKAIPTIKPRP